MLKALNVDGKALIVMPEVDKMIIKSAANIPGIKTTLVNTLNVYDILNYDKFIVVQSAVEKNRGGVRIMKAAQDIIIKPIITERSMDLLQAGKYTFKVDKRCNKIEIAKAVEELFNVKVAKVNTMNCNGRQKRVGKFVGKKPDWKKAIVTLKSDSKTIEFFDGMI